MKTCSSCKKIKDIKDFYKRKNRKSGYTSECKGCFKSRMGNRHQIHKDILVKEAGGQCIRCGYDACTRILVFHHLDPSTKSFGISEKLSANLSILKAEVDKCVLLCPNCHGEKHLGIW